MTGSSSVRAGGLYPLSVAGSIPARSKSYIAIMKSECIKKYYDNGNVEYERWLLNGNYHREDGPAYISYYENGNVESESWLLNDKRHREDGPAYVGYYENGNVESEYWFLNGKEIKPKDHLIEIPKEELGKLSVLKKLVFVKVDNEYVFIKHWLRKDKEFYNKYKILF